MEITEKAYRFDEDAITPITHAPPSFGGGTRVSRARCGKPVGSGVIDLPEEEEEPDTR